MTTTEVTPTLNVKDAAQRLADLLGGNADRWRVWLANDRRPGRAQQLTPVMGPGRPRYQLAALEAFVTTERALRLKESGPSGRIAEVLKAVGIGEEGGSSTGRRLDCQVSAQLDEATGTGFIQMVVATPLLVYRLSPDQARDLAVNLYREAADAERYAAAQTDGAAK